MSKIKIGVIGPGLIFWKTHHPQFSKPNSNYLISSVLSASSAKNPIFNSSVFHTNDIDEFFRSSNFEAVFICSPIHNHYNHLMRSLNEDKWVFIEKPIVGSVEEVENLMKLSDEQKSRIFVGENYRYLPSLMKLKEIIDKKNTPPLFVELKNFQYMLSEHNPFTKTEWRKNPKHEGGLFLDLGIHLISVLNWFFKDIEILSNRIFSITKKFGQYDTLISTLMAKDGEIINLNLSYGLLDDDSTVIKLYYSDCSYKCSKTELKEFTTKGEKIYSYDDGADIKNEHDTFYKMVKRFEPPYYSLNQALFDIRNCFELMKNF